MSSWLSRALRGVRAPLDRQLDLWDRYVLSPAAGQPDENLHWVPTPHGPRLRGDYLPGTRRP
ncbi:hypothetical protein [Amycolatopsis sp. H20-H5]|uniref:hypothetical protein n=1 Tax=Amycolatopsis sp. H20-H5 TaxID=3046309 RepID=UPI002DB56252|nr:hypothetical protein [Amycolatopsis sp. H20-H5]MEC3978266.1 hypothetical protein [Amycolatopsis sp. H20-H5]